MNSSLIEVLLTVSAFQDTREKTEQKVMVHLLREIERNPSFTQRGLASELGIALGLMNQYLKRCVKKGWIRASQISPRRITYFLTPKGLKEKSQMVKNYLASSLCFFRAARTECEKVFSTCQAQGWLNVALVGDGDLADIAKLVVQGTKVEGTVVDTAVEFDAFDKVLVTDVINPQGVYDVLKNKVDPEKLVILELLHISKGESNLGAQK